MNFKAAVTVSIVLHLCLFAITFFMQGSSKKSGTTYYVDLMSMPGGSSGGGKGGGSAGQLIEKKSSIRDLTVKKPDEPGKSKLRYPDPKSKKNIKEKDKKKDDSVTVVKKNKDKFKDQEEPLVTTIKRTGTGTGTGTGGLRTGISAGNGSGSGTGSGNGNGIGNGIGDGIGDGMGIGNFPYAYYIQTLRNKIANSWYSALVSPGASGKLVAVVYFKIMRNGQVIDLRLETASGNESLDLSAQRAIKDASPFPPLPNDFPDSYLGVHFEFAWEK